MSDARLLGCKSVGEPRRNRTPVRRVFRYEAVGEHQSGGELPCWMMHGGRSNVKNDGMRETDDEARRDSGGATGRIIGNNALIQADRRTMGSKHCCDHRRTTRNSATSHRRSAVSRLWLVELHGVLFPTIPRDHPHACHTRDLHPQGIYNIVQVP